MGMPIMLDPGSRRSLPSPLYEQIAVAWLPGRSASRRFPVLGSLLITGGHYDLSSD